MPMTEPENVLTVRPATTADEAAVLALIEQLFDPPSSRPPGYTPELGRLGFRWALDVPNADVLLAFEGDHAAGLSSVYADIQSIRFGPRCWLQDLVVEKTRRGSGIGAALIRASAAWARQRGCTHLELSSGAARTDAHRFYISQAMVQSYTFTLWL
jgi:GNAT superfamily N-acetyltransferase